MRLAVALLLLAAAIAIGCGVKGAPRAPRSEQTTTSGDGGVVGCFFCGEDAGAFPFP